MHSFADERALLGVPHLLNTISCLPLVIAGGVGLGHCAAEPASDSGYARTTGERLGLILFFALVIATGFGWSYYHVAPSADRALFDTLPGLASLVLLAFVGRGHRDYTRRTDLVAAVALITLGLLAGWLDTAIYSAGELLSGHTLEHLLAGAAAGLLVKMVIARRPVAG